MATDFWPTQFGRTHDVLTLDCEASGAISEGSAVKFGTTGASKIVVTASAAVGDGFGVALKAASATGDVIPVLVHGVFKCVRDNGSVAINPGQAVINSITCTSGQTNITGASMSTATAKWHGGACYCLGMALHGSNVDGDSVLVLVGRTP